MCAGLAFPALAHAAYAPVNAPGPPLGVPHARLAASLHCSGDLRGAAREPVLLTPATTVRSDENFAWNYERSFAALGIPFCASDLPGAAAQNMTDIQARGPYITYAIRHMYKLAHRRIAIVGHSQGGMVMRWSLRFWPDTRRMVRDVIGMAATNHGSAIVPALCLTPCAPALWQQRSDSAFVRALNSGQETFAHIDYTEIFSHTDEFVQPNQDSRGTSSLHGPGRITNVAIQDICPTDTTDHLLVGTTNAVAAALVFDALSHAGPADPRRIGRGVCAQLFMPGVDPLTGPANIAAAVARVARELALAPRVAAEPPLACYVTASCR